MNSIIEVVKANKKNILKWGGIALGAIVATVVALVVVKAKTDTAEGCVSEDGYSEEAGNEYSTEG